MDPDNRPSFYRIWTVLRRVHFFSFFLTFASCWDGLYPALLMLVGLQVGFNEPKPSTNAIPTCSGGWKGLYLGSVGFSFLLLLLLLLLLLGLTRSLHGRCCRWGLFSMLLLNHQPSKWFDQPPVGLVLPSNCLAREWSSYRRHHFLAPPINALFHPSIDSFTSASLIGFDEESSFAQTKKKSRYFDWNVRR